MRSNSGKDEGRNNLSDPSLKEHERARGKTGEAVLDRNPDNREAKEATDQMTIGLGSGSRKSGQRGAER